MKYLRQKSLVALLVGIFVFILGSFILLFFAGQKLAASVEEDANHFINHIDAAIQERRQILTPLNGFNFKECNYQNLLEMRRALFDANYVIDIGFFFDDKLVCTTGTGMLAAPLDDRQPDFIRQYNQTGADANIKVRFESKLRLLLFEQREMQVIIVRQGNYNLIIDSKAIEVGKITSPYWEATYVENNKLHHLTGVEGIYDEVSNLSHLPFSTGIVCSEKISNYCVAVHIPWNYFFSENQFLLTISFLLTCLAGVSSALLFDYLITAKRSTYNRVRKGLSKGSFYWTYQPIVCLHSGKVVGCEVLARFSDKYGDLSPDQFIPLIRKNNLTWSFTETMVSKVLKELATIAVLPDGFKVSFNIFPCDVEQDKVLLLITMPEIISSRFIICLEITEDEYLDTTIAHANFRTLVQSGFYLALDDFGTGYSNLKNLQNLSFQQLKIDRTFVQDITTQGLKASMIPNIIELVDKFNFTCVAEGIETSEQEAMLKTAGVHYGQGWKYLRPMKFSNFEHYLQNKCFS